MVLFALTAFVLSSGLRVVTSLANTTRIVLVAVIIMMTQLIRVVRRGFVLNTLSTLANTRIGITVSLANTRIGITASPVNHLPLVSLVKTGNMSLVKTANMSPVNHLSLVKTVNHMLPVSPVNLLPHASPVNINRSGIPTRMLPRHHQEMLLKIRANLCVLAVGLVELPLKGLKA
jgi:hypothetical protein